MEYSQIILEMLERIKVLENEVKELKSRNNAPTNQIQRNTQLDKVSIKYRKLAEFLLASGETRVQLTYSQIESILGFALPDTARNFPKSYWANTETHSYSSSWMAVGYKTRVDVDTNTVTFIKNL